MSGEVSPYVSINRILAKLKRDLGSLDSISEADIIEWAAEALQAIGAVTLYEEAVAFIEINNHQATLPNGLHAIVQLAKNTCWDDVKQCGLCPSEIVVATVTEEQVAIPVPLDCYGKPIQDYDLAYYRPYFDLRDETGYWGSSSLYQNCFTPIRLANHSFFNSLVCTNPDQQKAYTEGSGGIDEYTIINGDTLRVSFSTGQIILSYVRQQVDEDGYPMIPDHYAYTTAITKYVIMKLMEREFYASRDGSAGKLQKAEQDWHWYCKQARNRAMMPKGVDAWQNIMEQRQYILPRINRYYGFFGKMSRPESRKYNDPDSRNY